MIAFAFNSCVIFHPLVLTAIYGKSQKSISPNPPQEKLSEAAYLLEWDESLVDRDITNLNAKEVSGKGAFDHILYGSTVPRRNDGRVNDATLKRYRHLEHGGWWCAGIDLLTGEDSLWGCLKALQPKQDMSGKLIKYEHPLREPLGIFALKVSSKQFELVARRHDIELPIGWQTVDQNPWIFWKWVIDNPSIPVIVTEGAKKAGCVLSCGYVCIGLPGINSGLRIERDEYGDKILNSKPSLSPQLKVLAVEGRRFYIAFDQDKKRSTVRSVNHAISTLGKTFEGYDCKSHILTWHPVMGKGVDDVLFGAYQANIANGILKNTAQVAARETFNNIFRDAVELGDWETSQLRKLTYPINLELEQRFIGELLPPVSEQWICVKSPKNTGKSTWLKWLLLPSILSGEKRILGISHRVQLATQLSEALRLPIVTEASLESGKNGYFLCVDSLHEKSQAQFDYREWAGATVILDEIQQVLWHLLNSSTCLMNRVAIIKNLKNLLNDVIRTGGRIIMLDADLSDVSIDFIRTLLDISINPWIVENSFDVQPWNIFKFSGTTPQAMIDALLARLRKGERHMLCVSAQKKKSKWGTQVLEDYFARLCPGLRILRIDSESVADPDHKAFGSTKNLTEVIKEYDLVICSPTIETGVSIQEPDEPSPHFQGVWLIGQGVQTCDSVRQNLARYRPPVDRYIWVKEYGISRVGNGSQTVKGLLSGEFKKDKANVKRLIECGLQEISSNNFESICLTTWARMGAIINRGMGKYAHTILRDLEAEGHTILGSDEIDNDDNLAPSETDIKVDITEVRDELYSAYKVDVSKANSLTDSIYETLSTQAQKREHERLEFRKGQLERRYLVPITPEMVGQDDEGWHSAIRLDYFLHEGKRFLPDREKNVLQSALERGDGDYFVVDTNKQLLGNKLACLEWLGLPELEQYDELHPNHPKVLEIFAKLKGLPREGVTEAQAKSQAYAAELVLGTNFRKEKGAIPIIQRIYQMIGKRLPFLRREGGKGAQIRIYGRVAPDFLKDDDDKLVRDSNGLPIPLPDGRTEIFAAWVKRDEEAQSKRQAEAAEREKAIAQQYAMTQEEEEQAVGLAEYLPEVEDKETFDLVAKPFRLAVVVAAMRSLSTEIQERLLVYCQHLKSLVCGNPSSFEIV